MALRAVMLEEVSGPFDVLLLEDPGVGTAEQRGTEAMPDPVADLAADERPEEGRGSDQPDVEPEAVLGRQQPGGEQERVAREDQPEQQPRLREDDHEEADGPERLEQVLRVEEVERPPGSAWPHDIRPWAVVAQPRRAGWAAFWRARATVTAPAAECNERSASHSPPGPERE